MESSHFSVLELLKIAQFKLKFETKRVVIRKMDKPFIFDPDFNYGKAMHFINDAMRENDHDKFVKNFVLIGRHLLQDENYECRFHDNCCNINGPKCIDKCVTRFEIIANFYKGLLPNIPDELGERFLILKMVSQVFAKFGRLNSAINVTLDNFEFCFPLKYFSEDFAEVFEDLTIWLHVENRKEEIIYKCSLMMQSLEKYFPDWINTRTGQTYFLAVYIQAKYMAENQDFKQAVQFMKIFNDFSTNLFHQSQEEMIRKHLEIANWHWSLGQVEKAVKWVKKKALSVAATKIHALTRTNTHQHALTRTNTH